MNQPFYLISIILLGVALSLKAQEPVRSEVYRLMVGSGGQDGGIYAYDFNTRTGEYRERSRTTDLISTSYFTLSHDQQRVYSVGRGENGEGSIRAFDWNPGAGKLTLLNQVSAGGEGPAYVATDKDDTYVFAGNYGSGSLSAVPVQEDGSLSTDIQIIQHTGSSINQARQTKPHVHCTTLSPDGRYLLAADLGTDKINVYRIDTRNQTHPLTPAEPAFVSVKPGSGPRHLVFHPTGKFAYLIQEIEGLITVFDYQREALQPRQTVTMVPENFTGNFKAADIHVSPDGKFLYGSNRGDLNELVIYAIEEDGRLTFVGRQSTLGETPRNFVIDPTGNYLLVGNRTSNHIVIFSRDLKTGLLAPTGKKIEVDNPMCLKFAAAASHSRRSEESYTLRVHDVSVTIDAGTGARVTSLTLANREILGTKSIHPKYYGSSLWMSPQDTWGGLQKVLDTSAYEVSYSDQSALHLISKIDSTSGFRFSKRFQTNPADTSILIRYTLTNFSDETKEVAPWEVTRVPAGGLAFFPKGSQPALPKSTLTVRDSIGLIWYPPDTSMADSRQKLFMNGSEGWLAHLQDGIVFIKQFPDISPSRVASGEEEVEIYTNKERTYVELENQGAYQRLVSRDSLVYEVKWYVRDIPRNIPTQVGSKALVEYVKSTVR